MPGILGLCSKEVVGRAEKTAKHGTKRSVKCCSLLLGLSFATDLETCQGEQNLAPESFKSNTSFQTGEAEKREN